MRKRFLIVGALWLAGALGMAGQSLAADSAAPLADPIHTRWVLELRVKLGTTEELGASFDGVRSVYPIAGGTFHGEFAGAKIAGTVVPGGGDFFVQRPDGTGIVDALYRLRTSDGATILIHNRGIYTPTAEGRRKEQAGQKLLPQDQYCRTVPEFTAPAGPYDWLNRSIFVGTIEDGEKDEVIIRVFRVE